MIPPLFLSQLFALLIAPPAIAQQGADSWQTFQNGPTHVGTSPVRLTPGGMAFAWQTNVSSGELGQAVIADGAVVVTQSAGFERGVYAMDPSTGTLTWSFVPAGGGVHFGHAALYDGKVYVQNDESGQDYLRVFDANNGTSLLRAPLDDQGTLHYAPVLDDGVLYVNTGRFGGVAALDPSTGTELWYYEMELGDEWSPTITDDVCYGWGTGRLVAVDRATGAEIFDVKDFDAATGGVVGHTPVPGHGHLYIVDGGRLVCHDQMTGEILWTVEEAFTDQVSVADEGIYALNGGALQLRAPADGALIDQFSPASGTLGRNVILTPDHLVVASEIETHLLDRSTLSSVWSHPAGGWLSLGEGLLLIAGSTGQLTAISYPRLPQPFQVTPDRLNYYESQGETVTIQGFGFDDGTTPSVSFGGVTPTLVTVVDDHTLECVLPNAESSVADLSITNSVGTDVLNRGFAFSPTLEASGNFQLGGQVRLAMRFEPGLQVAGVYDFGAARATGLTIPSMPGEFWLEQYQVLFEVLVWPFGDSLELDFNIPNDPVLQGQSIQIQAVAGNNPRARQGAFTQLATIVIL